MKRLPYLLLAVLLLLTLGNTGTFAQATASGTIQGTITDQSQGVVQGAEITAKNKGTDLTRTISTSDTGYYRIELLPVGVYAITVTKTGFATTASTIEVMVGQAATFDVTLKPGATSETVEISSDVPLVDQAKTDVSQNITPKQVEELPLLGRDVANLAYLAPGVKMADSYDPTKNRYAVLSVNGQDGRNVNVTINGLDNKDNTIGGTVMQVPLEAVEEFIISTQRFSAANGRSEGAAINLITKSGTNNFHGSAFGFFRDQAFNAENFFEKQPGGEKGPYSRQFFGGSVGGPIVKDKLFGFFAFERQREHTSVTEGSDALNELQIAKAAGLAADPAAVIPTPFYENRYNARLDYKFNDRQNAYVSYTSQANNSLNDQSLGLSDLTQGNFTKNHLQAANATLNSVFTPSLVNSFLVGFQYWNNIIDSTTKVPFVTFPGGISFGTSTNVPQQSYQHKYQFRDDITKTIQAHTLKFGVDYVFDPNLGGFFESNATPEIDFNDVPSVITTDTAKYPQGFATPGIFRSISGSSGNPYFKLSPKQLGLYGQDTWKVTRRLTLDLGLRWDKDFGLVGADAMKNSRTFQKLTAIGSPFASLPGDDSKDFSPRVGFAYDLTGHARHILRGGYGLYYGNIFENIPLFMIQQANPTIFQQVFNISSPTDIVPGTNIQLQNYQFGLDPLPVIPPASGDLAAGATGRLMDPHFRNPVSQQFNIGYQWALNSRSVVEVEYVHELGLHEDKTININPHIATAFGVDAKGNPIITNDARPLAAAFADAGVTALGRTMDEQSVNRSRYDGLNFSYRQQMYKHVSLNANYTLSRAMGWAIQSGGADAGSGFRNYPHDPLNPWDPRDFGPTPNDERHHVTLSGIVELPLGFQVSPILQYGSARPIDLRSGIDILDRGSGYSIPVIVPNDDPTNYTFFNTTATLTTGNQQARALQCLAAGDCHQVGYDTLRGDPFFQMDMRVAKNIRLGEGRRLQLIFQAFNLTNKVNFGNNYTNSTNSGNFLKPAGFINPASTFTPRAFIGEFGARFTF